MPTAGVTLHLILPHSLRCPADTYFTQVAMHYPHLQYPDGQTVAFGHYEDPLPDQLAAKLPTDLQNVPYYCSGYRLLHWSPRLSQGSNRLPPDDVVTILKVAATLSFYVARQVRRNQESSKLLILTPHNDTVEDIIDAVGLPSDNLPPSLYEFYLVMIYKQQLLPTTISEFKRTDHAGKQFTPHLENVTLQEIHAKISNDPTLHQELERRATIETIVQIALTTFQKVFPPTAPSPTLLRPSALEGSPQYLYRVRSPTFSPKPRKPKLAIWSPSSPVVRAFASFSFPVPTNSSLRPFIFSVLSVLFGMVCLVSGLLPLTFPN